MSRSPDSRKTKGRRPASGKVREVGKAAVKAGSDRVQGKVATEVQWITVDEDMAGQRVDNFLLARLRGVPKSIVYRIVRKGEVRVNKGRVKPDTRLNPGDVVRIPPLVQQARAEQPKPGSRVQGVMEAAVVFENDEIEILWASSGG